MRMLSGIVRRAALVSNVLVPDDFGGANRRRDTGRSGAICLSEEIDVDGREIFAAAAEHGLEGIIAKHKDSTYRSGRLGDWLKIKCVQSDSFMIVGEQSQAGSAVCDS